MPCVLIILDGWGIAPAGAGNAIALADTPNMDRYWDTCPHSALEASGLAVGLPEGQIGNSEVGHLNLGAGYRVLQELPRIDEAIKSGSFFENEALCVAVDRARDTGATLHLLGLFSSGGVHSHAHHLYALLDLAARRGLRRVSVHPLLDGRDTPPEQALHDLPDLEAKLAETGVGRIATISGRYYAMDRDSRWDRVQREYEALVDGEGEHAPSALEAVHSSYAKGVTDEFVVPTIIDGPPSTTSASDGPSPTIRDGDVVLWFNYRADRSRELTQALLPDFTAFERRTVSRDLFIVTFTQYSSTLPVQAVAFLPQNVESPIARVISDANVSQAHIAETEKYAHVTYFFNGGREEPFHGEERVLVQSPKVATYDLQPEMSASGVADAAVALIESGKYAFLVMNFANGDMVGHTGMLDAAIKAAETVDACVGRVVEATLAAGGIAAITADHGNAEEMVDVISGEPKTAHTENPVPFIVIGAPAGTTLKPHGVLADAAPTLLQLMQLPVPPTMTADGLLESGFGHGPAATNAQGSGHSPAESGAAPRT